MNVNPIEINCEWDDWGYIAKSPTVGGFRGNHFPGPRGAAEQFAAHHFGQGQYTLKIGLHRLNYQAVSRKTNPKWKRTPKG